MSEATQVHNREPDPLRFWVTLVFVFCYAIISIGVLITSRAFITPRFDDQRTASELRGAIMQYVTEHKRFPALPNISPNADAIVDTSEADGLITVLAYAPGNVLATRLNPEGIRYFRNRSADSAKAKGFWLSGTGAHLRDKWSRHFVVYLDSDSNNQVDMPYPDGTVETIYNVLVIRGLGKNGVIDHTPGFKNDDVLAQ